MPLLAKGAHEVSIMDSTAVRQWPENMILSRPATAREGKMKR